MKRLLALAITCLPLACTAEPKAPQAPAEAPVKAVVKALENVKAPSQPAADPHAGHNHGNAAAPAPVASAAPRKTYVRGRHYMPVNVATPTPDANVVDVVEVFWYGCGHCNHFEPYVKNWKANMPAGTSFRRVPAALNKRWALHARAYYTAEVLNALEQVHEPIFTAIHQHNNPLHTPERIATLFATHGIPKDKFFDTFNSFAVEVKLNAGKEAVRNYGIRSVPTMVVNGKWWTNATKAGGMAQMINVVNYLVEMEQAGEQ